MNRTVGGVAVVAGVAVSLLLGVFAAWLAVYSWSQITGYVSPYPTPTLPAASAGPALTDRLVLVIVDGLRFDVSRKMPALQTLRQHGSDLELTAPEPSVSFPNWTTILSGAPPAISGVTSNDHAHRVAVETLLDSVALAGGKSVVVGPKELDTLFGARNAAGSYFASSSADKYLSSTLVVRTVRLTETYKPRLVLLHLPDVDEAGHRYGGASRQYLDTAMKVDTDLSVLVNALQDGHTTFVVVADHGHTDAGGHGGDELSVTHVPAVLAGPGVALGSGTGQLQDIAPTAATLAGLPSPREAFGRVLPSVLATPDPVGVADQRTQRLEFIARYLTIVRGPAARGGMSAVAVSDLERLTDRQIQDAIRAADDGRLLRERTDRWPLALAVVLGAGLLFAAIGVQSWRALVAALAGAVAFYGVFDGLYFGVHRLTWSLSAIRSERLLAAFFAARLAEAVIAALAAAVVAGIVYPLLRQRPKGSWGEYRAGWLALGPATVLAAQATLVLQAAWYLWLWGTRVTWMLPDLQGGFKYELDLLQVLALGLAAPLACVATLLVGRYHPMVARPAGPEPDTEPGEE